ncbi:hypothetical protein M9434_006785 [Picochlorum sp. BPE23]|nr:hypothetical protein M9434_006785 [Picochlorum sp. BPE23]
MTSDTSNTAVSYDEVCESSSNAACTGQDRAKRSSYLAVILLAFGLTIDFSMALMSLQTFYHVLQGPPRAYGIVFASYELFALLGTPIFGYLSDCTSTFKLLFMGGLVLNLFGNLMYAFSFLADAWWLILLGRSIAGFGSATTALGASYLTQTTTMEERQSKIVSFRLSQTVASAIGPMVGFIFLFLPEVGSGSPTSEKIFNWYTISGWIATLVMVVVILSFFLMFEDPSSLNGHLVVTLNGDDDDDDDDDVDCAMTDQYSNDCEVTNDKLVRQKFRDCLISWLIVVFFCGFLISAFFCNVFAVFSAQFHGVTTQTGMWKVWIASLTSIIGNVMNKVGIKFAPKFFDERQLVITSQIFITCAYLLVIPYHGPDSTPPEALYYTAVGCMGFGLAFYFTSSEAIFSKKISQYAEITAGRMASYQSLFYIVHYAGSCAGPIVIGAATYITSTSGSTPPYCAPGGQKEDPYGFSANGHETCQGNLTESCAFFGHTYFVSGCKLNNMAIVYSVYAGVSILTIAWTGVCLKRHWSYNE